MHEHIARVLYYLQVHLWYASIVCLACWLLTSVCNGSATTKYWIWIVTAINFLVPTGAIIDKLWSSHLSWATPLTYMGAIGVTIADSPSLTMTICAVWLTGMIFMFMRLFLRLRSERRDAQGDAGIEQRRFLTEGVPVSIVAKRLAPAVNGVLRPLILLPDGIETLLNEHELDAVLVHELTHARRKDNLMRLIYETCLCILWFHPLVWLTGSRLSLFRELSCDESVIRKARGRELVSALTKLTDPQKAFLLQATVSSFLQDRVQLLLQGRSEVSRAANKFLAATFSIVLLLCLVATVSHTACCFFVKK